MLDLQEIEEGKELRLRRASGGELLTMARGMSCLRSRANVIRN